MAILHVAALYSSYTSLVYKVTRNNQNYVKPLKQKNTIIMYVCQKVGMHLYWGC